MGDKVTIEALDVENYGTWSIWMKALLIHKKLWKDVEDPSANPDESQSPKSRASFFNHSASFTALAAPIYSASTVYTATVTCRRLDHDMAPPADINT
jgi:hypothetical protein